MNTIERFNYLIDQYVEDYLSFKEKDELFQMISTGDYDNIIGAHFENSIAKIDVDQKNALSPDCYSKIKKMILDLDKKIFYINKA